MQNLNLLSFAFVDTSLFAATMTLKYGRYFSADAPADIASPNCRYIVLREATDIHGGDECADTPLFDEWPSSRKIVEDVGAQIVQHLGASNLVLGKVYIESLQSGGYIPWRVDNSPYGKAHIRFRLLASPCAGGVWFSGSEGLMPGVGNLTYLNHLTLHSAVNLGPVPQISLVVDVRRPMLQ